MRRSLSSSLPLWVSAWTGILPTRPLVQTPRKFHSSLFWTWQRLAEPTANPLPVLWCTGCRTSISQAELYPVEKETTYYYLPFAVGGDRLSVATTRPELLYGCVALFVHPDDERYAQYIGDQATVPLYGYTVPILADSSVEMEKSSGVVMCATFWRYHRSGAIHGSSSALSAGDLSRWNHSP